MSLNDLSYSELVQAIKKRLQKPQEMEVEKILLLPDTIIEQGDAELLEQNAQLEVFFTPLHVKGEIQTNHVE